MRRTILADMDWQDVHRMIVIAGGPRTGKTTLAAELGGLVLCTDDVMSLGWSEASQRASHWFDGDADVVEGVAVPRALRKWLARNPHGKPCERVIWLAVPRQALSDGQERMRKGCVTVWSEVKPELIRRGVMVETRGA